MLLGIGFAADVFVAGEVGSVNVVVRAIYVAATIVGVRYFAIEAVNELIHERHVDIELLMSVAAFTAGALGMWGESATLAFLYSISEALEGLTDDRTRGAIRALMDLAPKRVTRLGADGREEEIDVAALVVGDRFRVRPGQSVATDGTIEEGRSAIDEAGITGESVPVDKAPGAKVFAGTLNATGSLVVRATASAADNTLAKIVRLVSEAQEQKGRGEAFVSRFARRYSPAVLVCGLGVGVAGGLTTGDWSEWAIRAATVLVAAAPCALVISIPISYVAAIGNAGRQGILIKGGIYLEELAHGEVAVVCEGGGSDEIVGTVGGGLGASADVGVEGVDSDGVHGEVSGVLGDGACEGVFGALLDGDCRDQHRVLGFSGCGVDRHDAGPASGEGAGLVEREHA